ncbi:glycosyltransferase involved in cell wall biosynthesis [Dyadobacter jejuensis]|uniref:Glycosyltransferase involved in cell wall biosynthesis n=1 Tax=Dyadobacter jejuensis TaxID=1082580 RepID=A0A316AM12_9BACT|nr:glycosyltransferase family 1 protein [Dyadobacter jejuensis]PWJ58783.1 glycosyltransferase involved in cell wall biosynthesis [Dyadobacter jejuensis]
MPKILFDHQKFTTQRYGGISRYFANIVQQIAQSTDFSSEVGLLYSQNHYLSPSGNELDRFMSPLLRHHRLSDLLYKANQAYSHRLVKKDDFDLFHPTYYDTYFLEDLKKPMVTTIHDMTYEKLPEYFWAQDPLTHNKRLHIERADAIIAISETTKSDLMRYHRVDEDKIRVIYHGIDLKQPLEFAPVEGLPDSYLLYVGDRSGYKNFYLFIDAFKAISQKYPKLEVILTGGGRLGIADQELLHRLGLTQKVKHVQVTDEQLNTLYSRAEIFVYPSLHEGFGLPILEAFKANCPVLLSDTPCFREIAQSAVAYFQPHSLDDFIEQIDQLLAQPDRRTQLVQRGNKRLQDFPIEKSIKETLALYVSLMK